MGGAGEVQTVAVDAAGGLVRWRRKHAPPPGSLCANCPWCHECGQLGEDFHRSAWRLLGEAIEGLFDADGRLAATLPGLVFNPGRLTRGYLDGKRAPQIPPFRLYLIVVVLLFFAAGIGADKTVVVAPKSESATAMASVEAELAAAHLGAGTRALASWVMARGRIAERDPQRFISVLETWGQRGAILMLPIATLLLGALFVFQRRFYVFDHAVFAMHSLSFLGLVLALALPLLNEGQGWAAWLLLAPPLHLFSHMRGVYGTSVAGTLVRMALLFVASALAFAGLIVGLVFIGLSAMGR